MPSLAFALRNLLRDLKSGELAVLVLALLYWIVRDPQLVGYVAGGQIGRASCRERVSSLV
mgnify:CR=1 FL=1